ncbi:MAG: hypothetical protein PHZ09_07175 [Eubacteriales bacterium]|nr:hypothetical protein [Eubacteriales bacterium]
MKRHKIPAAEIMICLICAAVFIVLCNAIGAAALTGDTEGAEIAERSLKRAAVTCYAIEGRYPADIGYLTDNYYIFIDTDRYLVHYAATGPNLMPDIKVLPR